MDFIPTDAELTYKNERIEAWSAISELWLDTHFDDGEQNYVSSILANSRFTIPEIEHMYLYEVAPVVFVNLLSVAGVWEGFDKDWLADTILKRRRRRLRPMYWLTRIGIGRLVMCRLTGAEKDWQEILKRVETIRAQEECQ